MVRISFIMFLAACLLSLPCPRADETPAISTPLMSNSMPTRETLRPILGGEPISFEEIAADSLDGVDVLVWSAHSAEFPEESRDPAVVGEIQRFVKRGGGLLLLSLAQGYTVELGLESVRPDRMDYSSTRGEVGVHRQVDHPVFAGLVPDASDPNVFYLADCTFLSLETGVWERTAPEHARRLGHYIRRTGDDVLDSTVHKSLNEWTLERGRVLGYGHNLFLESYWDNQRADNARTFLLNMVRYLARGKASPRVAVLPETPSRLHADLLMSPPELPRRQPHSLSRELPGLPYIAHFGWLGAVNYQRERRNPPVNLEYYRTKLIDEAWRWGANLLEFFPEDHGFRGFSMTWEADDAIPRAESYLQDEPFWPQWDWPEMREVTRLAHERDFIIHTFWHRRPARSFNDTMDFTELVGRELMNPLLYGRMEAQDGFGVEGWFSDPQGETFSRVWPYNPGSYFHTTAVLPGRSPALSGSWMCAMGRVSGSFTNGYGGRWRYLQHPPLYLGYQADCRAQRPSRKESGWSSSFGGGSAPDWILRQVNDFCRDRLYLDSAIWWLGEPSETLPAEYRPYVYAISANPMRVAVTTPLHAIGEGGYRDQSRAAVPTIPERWVNRVPLPQDTSIIQNNYFRLARLAGEDRGLLQYDPHRTAFYEDVERRDPLVEISRDLLSCSTPELLSDARASDEVVFSVGVADGSDAESRGMGGYGKAYTAGGDASLWPARIGYEIFPAWPQEVQLPLPLPAGRYRLEVDTLPVPHNAIVNVALDGEKIGDYFPVPGKTRYGLAFSITEPGEHTLALHVERAHEFPRYATPSLEERLEQEIAHAFDAVRVRRIANVAVGHTRPLPVGHTAELEETVAFDAEGSVRQRRTYRVDADFPMLRVEIENTAPHAVAWDARLRLPNYGAPQPVPGTARTWRLAPKSGNHPALGLFVEGDDVESVEMNAGEVVLRFAKARRSGGRLALLVDDGLYSPSDYASVAALAFAPRPRLALEAEHPVTHKNPLPIPRVEVVQVGRSAGTPYLVAEAGGNGETWWTARGAQVDGNDDLLGLYLQAGGAARVQPYGFIEGVVKPGWGCQYMLAIRDTIRPRTCEVKVVKTGPFVFAPRIEWKQPFDAVWVNGKPWRYFDGNIVFLPNRPGSYEVRVDTTGARAPVVTRTFLEVAGAEWDAGTRTLDLDLRAPHWWKGPLAGDRPYTLTVAGDARPVRLEGRGEIIAWDEYRMRPESREKMQARGATLRLWPGRVRIVFGPVSSQ